MLKLIKSLLPATLLCCSMNFVVAQNKLLTMDDVVLKSRTEFAPENIEQLEWISGSDNFSFVKKEGGNTWLVSSSVQGKENRILSLTDINRLTEGKGPDTLKAIPDINWTSSGTFSFDHKGFVYEYSLKSGQLAKTIKLPGAGMENMDRFSQKGPIAATYGNNVWIFKRCR